ncbi:9517_t:CDS:2 [Diversispora eburnea]|uniref:Protein N-terminal glutamine amidohydrolase n=1 Tax=Diversispora eburnea TaxID=1213867 RepID=A0A9N8YZA5_9GLOM|nr:9517_t:CDS:2 [Diversispora eburnea]
MLPPLSDKLLLKYTPNYCEENIYFLCKEFSSIVNTLDNNNKFNVFACFISNEHKAVPFLKQRLAKDPDQFVVWTYVSEALAHVIEKRYQRYYRIVPLETFLKVFASDRSHMKKEDNTWIAPPPDYPPISNKESKMNLQNFISMSESENLKYGTILDEQQFKEFCDLTQ